MRAQWADTPLVLQTKNTAVGADDEPSPTTPLPAYEEESGTI